MLMSLSKMKKIRELDRSTLGNKILHRRLVSALTSRENKIGSFELVLLFRNADLDEFFRFRPELPAYTTH